MKKPTTEKIRRRAFLKGATLGGVVLGSGALTTGALAEVSVEPSQPATKGYRETDHIREYYRVARF